MTDLVPSFTKPVVCNHCGNKAALEIVASYEQIQTHELSPTNNLYIGQEWEAGQIWELARCQTCYKLSLLEMDIHTGMEPELAIVGSRVLYPLTEKDLVNLPPDVARAYQAALRIRHVDSNAFAVLLGRVLDIVCIDREVSGKSLYCRLTSLAERGEIPGRLAEMAHQLRQMRNIGAHADLGDLTSAEVPFLDDLCRAILEYVYTAPKLIEQVELRLHKLKQDGKDVEQKR